MSHTHDNLLSELNLLQNRIEEMRAMLYRENIEHALPDNDFDILLCQVDREFLGMILKDVDEVLPICLLTPVPDAPPWFAGLLNIGGEMVPVVDLKVRISGDHHEVNISDSIVICTTNGKRVGFIISEVSGIHAMIRSEVQAVPDSLVSAPYLLGIAEIDNNTVLLLNIPRLSSIYQFSTESS